MVEKGSNEAKGRGLSASEQVSCLPLGRISASITGKELFFGKTVSLGGSGLRVEKGGARSRPQVNHETRVAQYCQLKYIYHLKFGVHSCVLCPRNVE